MSDYIDTREDWRELTVRVEDLRAGDIVLDPDPTTVGGHVKVRREAPVPPLPTVPYTVIRVELKHTDRSSCDLVLDETGAWCAVQADMEWGPAQVVEMMTGGFEVLAEPRAHVPDREVAYVRRETAKAVLDRVYQEYPPGSFTDLTGMQSIAREFLVEP